MAISLITIGILFSYSFAKSLNPFYAQLEPCPSQCIGQPQDWTVYSSVDRLSWCKETQLLQFAVHAPLDDANTLVKIHSCLADNETRSLDTALLSTGSLNKTTCSSGTKGGKNVSLDLITSGESNGTQSTFLHHALQHLQNYLEKEPTCDTQSIFALSQKVAIGVYFGGAFSSSHATAALLSRLRGVLTKTKAPTKATIQLCGNQRPSDYVFGIAIDMTGDLAAVQKSVATWHNASCVDVIGSAISLNDLSVPQGPQENFKNNTSNTSSNLTISSNRYHNLVNKQADCKVITVVSGDSCGSLASKCSISGDDFMTYNPQPNLCATLAVGQRVCCSPGTLPDIRPKPNPDGSCATYLTKPGDTCGSIAGSNGLTLQDLATFNDKTTWGWVGCDGLPLSLNMCLSSGAMPMPASLTGAVCGPQVPNTKKPSPITPAALSGLNPCPLNACCDKWGSCGITPEFCTSQDGPTGNPGTLPPGTNGCFSNCGTEIVNNKVAPPSFLNVAYYESWNFDRPCLNMRANSIASSATQYTHVHWGFGTVTNDFNVDINLTSGQWNDFLGLKDMRINRIVSFGGWGDSTEPATYNNFRRAIDPANVDKFADNVVKFVTGTGIEGVDFDWEYPGVTDNIMPGIPPGLASDGPNYLHFLKTLRNKLTSSKSISIAAPASFWYLKGFPIADMAHALNYIVYMTYDLHGQWDYNNKYSINGCPGGNCLRSHVNLTETKYALAMLTKAGVPSNQIVVGVSSYGRSFGMTAAGCTGPDCTYVGPVSGATAGECTGTPGYLADAEISNIIMNGDATHPVQTYHDQASDSDIVVYNQTQWIAHMHQTTKMNRKDLYKGLNFAGSVDWAIDLQFFTGDDGDPNNIEDSDPPTTALPPCTNTYASLEAMDTDFNNIPLHCRAQYTLGTLSSLYTTAVKNYTGLMNNGYDKKFQTYAKAVADSASGSVHDFMLAHGKDYFSCIVTEATFCCGQCTNEDGSCKYCRANDKGADCFLECNDRTNNCSPPRLRRDLFNITGTSSIKKVIKNRNQTEPCPPDFSQRGYGPGTPKTPGDYLQTVYWAINNDKVDAFYADLNNSTGIPKDKIKFGNYKRGNGCNSGSKPDDPCWGIGYDYNIPMPNGYGAGDVANPKNVASKALDSSNNLGPQLQDKFIALTQIAYPDNVNDLIDSVSIPILMVVEAIESMMTIEDVADHIDAEKRKAIILAFVGALLFFVPVAGEVVGSVTEMAQVASIITLLGAAGNAALDVYTIVADPKNAPLAIVGLILAPTAIADVVTIQKAANIRRGMAEADIAKLGTKLSSRMKTIQKVTGSCSKV